MDMYSDFHSDKWEKKGAPPENISTLDGYENQNIMRQTKEIENDSPVFKYYTSSDGGKPCQAVIYGASRDPLKSIGHCGMRIVYKNYLPLITGCIVEDDWVEMKQAYFDSLDVHGPEPKEDKPARLSMIIGLMGDLKNDKWQKKEDPPKNKSKLGYGYYIIVRQAEVGDLRSFYINDSDGRPLEAYLADSERNPLRSIGNCYLKLVKEGEKEMIKGIIVDDDWVEQK